MNKEKFMKNGVFSLEYDKETLKDMVLELQDKLEAYENMRKEVIKYIKENKEYWEEWHYDGTDIDIESDINHIFNIVNGSDN